MAHIAFTCFSGALNTTLKSFQDNSGATKPKPAQQLPAILPDNVWRLIFETGKEITDCSPEEFLLSAHQGYLENMVQKANELKGPLLKALPYRPGPPPQHNDDSNPRSIYVHPWLKAHLNA
jgi:hypothetical protein